VNDYYVLQSAKYYDFISAAYLMEKQQIPIL